MEWARIGELSQITLSHSCKCANCTICNRASFLDALVHFVDPTTVHFHKRCVSVGVSATNPSLSVIHFADGSTHEADVVIGADGIKSSTRTAIIGDMRKPAVFSNTICYRGLIPYEAVKAAGVKTDFSTGRPVIFVGRDKVRSYGIDVRSRSNFFFSTSSYFLLET